MALPVKHATVLGAAAVLAAAWLPAVSWAAGSAAPFKPPASTLAPPAQALAPPSLPTPAPAPEAVPAPEDPAASAPAQPLGLSGIRRGAHSAALIDGAWVDLGQTARGARLVAVTAHGAQLAHPDGRREFLPLSPEAQWSPHRPAAGGVVKTPVKEGRP